MIIKGLSDEDFVNYKLPSMFVSFPHCTFKCEKENETCCCQNSGLAKATDIDIDQYAIIARYLNNPITKAIVCGGLEPFDSFDDLLSLIKILRVTFNRSDPVVVYTGYNKDEIEDKVAMLKPLTPIVIKYGRYIPGMKPHYDDVLGVKLASDNQYGEELKNETEA